MAIIKGAFPCDVPGCSFVAKHHMGIGRHKSSKHGIRSKSAALREKVKARVSSAPAPVIEQEPVIEVMDLTPPPLMQRESIRAALELLFDAVQTEIDNTPKEKEVVVSDKQLEIVRELEATVINLESEITRLKRELKEKDFSLANCSKQLEKQNKEIAVLRAQKEQHKRGLFVPLGETLPEDTRRQLEQLMRQIPKGGE